MSIDVSECSATTRALIDMLIQRDQQGRAKYGATLDRTDLSHAEWLQHMAEELLDGAGYALAAKREAPPPVEASQQCPCGDREASKCPGEWEPGCDLGANEAHARRVDEASQQQASDEEQAWRKGWAMAYSGMHRLYGDDGELQDNSAAPCIDWRRDSASKIREKIRERGMRKLEQAGSQQHVNEDEPAQQGGEVSDE